MVDEPNVDVVPFSPHSLNIWSSNIGPSSLGRDFRDVTSFTPTSVSVDNDIMVLSTKASENGFDEYPAVMIFERNGFTNQWEDTASFVLPVSVNFYQWSSVSVSGKTIVVGSEGDSSCGDFCGAVHVYNQNYKNEWIRTTTLLPSTGEPGLHFGGKVAVSGDTIVVGAQGDSAPCGGANCGSAFVFERAPATGVWSQTQKLIPSNPEVNAIFGSNVAIENNTIVVVAETENTCNDATFNCGAVYIFGRSLSTGLWSQTQKLTPTGTQTHHFGSELDLDGDRLLLGTNNDDQCGHFCGAAWIFTKNPGTGVWSETIKLVPSDGSEFDSFGRTVAISGNTVAVGSDYWSGSVYIYIYNGSTWVETAKLRRLALNSYASQAMTLQDEKLYVGAIYEVGFTSCCHAPILAAHLNPSPSDTCLDCPAGGFSAQGDQFCTPCPIGGTTSTEAATSCSLQCDQGSYRPDNHPGDCMICDPGTYTSSSGLPSCTECEIGRYASEPGSDDCTDCSHPLTTYETGSVDCWCPAGNYSLSALDSSSVLGAPTFDPTDCSVCPFKTFGGDTVASAFQNLPNDTLIFESFDTTAHPSVLFSQRIEQPAPTGSNSFS